MPISTGFRIGSAAVTIIGTTMSCDVIVTNGREVSSQTFTDYAQAFRTYASIVSMILDI